MWLVRDLARKIWSSRRLYSLLSYMLTYLIVATVTRMTLLAMAAGAINYVLACRDWDMTHNRPP